MTEYVDVTDQCTFSPVHNTVIQQSQQLNVVYNSGDDEYSTFKTIRVYDRETFNKPYTVSKNFINCNNLFNGCVNFNSKITFSPSEEYRDIAFLFGASSNNYIFNQSINFPDNVNECMKPLAYCNNYDQPIKVGNNYNSLYGLIMDGSYTFMNSDIIIGNNIDRLQYMVMYANNFNSNIIFMGSYYNFVDQIIVLCPNFNKSIDLSNTRITNSAVLIHSCNNFNSPIYLNNVDGVDDITIINNVKYSFSSSCLIYSCHNFNTNIIFSDNAKKCTRIIGYCNNFNYPINIPNNAINISRMIFDCPNFNQPLIIPNTVEDMGYFLYGCYNFNQNIQIPDSAIDIGFCLSGLKNYRSNYIIKYGVINCAGIYYGLSNFNKSITIPNTVINCYELLSNCRNFNQPLIIPDNVTESQNVLGGCANFNQQVKLSNNSRNLNYFFKYCYNFNQPITIPNTAENVCGLFQSCYNFNQPITLHNNLKNLMDMFWSTNCNYPITIPNSVVDISGMLLGSNFNQSITIPNSDSLWRMESLFAQCDNFDSPVFFQAYPENVLDCYINHYHDKYPYNDYTRSYYSFYENRYTFYRIFSSCNKFNKNVTNLNQYKNFDSAFHNAINFNQPINNLGMAFSYSKNVNVTYRDTFNGAVSYNQSILHCAASGNAQGMFYRCSTPPRTIYFHGISCGEYSSGIRLDRIFDKSSFNNERRVNIYVDNGSVAYYGESTIINGIILTFTNSGNVRYNSTYNIYIYNNYNG